MCLHVGVFLPMRVRTLYWSALCVCTHVPLCVEGHAHMSVSGLEMSWCMRVHMSVCVHVCAILLCVWMHVWPCVHLPGTDPSCLTRSDFQAVLDISESLFPGNFPHHPLSLISFSSLRVFSSLSRPGDTSRSRE